MQLRSFLYLANPARVVFGAGALGRLPEEVERVGLSRVMVVSTPGREGHARSIAQLLGSRAAGIFARAQMHTPVEVTEAAITTAREIRADGLVAAGGWLDDGFGEGDRLSNQSAANCCAVNLCRL